MVIGAERMVIELEYRGIVPVTDARGARIDCLDGRVWLTQEGSPEDVVLEVGESHAIACRGLAVLQALRGARVALHAPAATRPVTRL
jgi:hypothetical protein